MDASPTFYVWNISENLTQDGHDSGLASSPAISWTFMVAKILMTYVLPVIVIAGLLGNTASFMVFLSHDLRKLSSSVYVNAALTSDTGLLVGLLFVWLEVLGIRLNHREGLCQFLVLLTYVCSYLSVWYTVCITVESYLAICHPTKVRSLCTKQRAVVVVSLLAVSSLPLYIVSAAATEVRVDADTGVSQCQRKTEDYQSAMRVLTVLDSLVTLLLPLLVVSCMLAAIALSILHTYRWRRRSERCPPGRAKAGGPKQGQPQGHELSRIPQVRVAKMLFALSLSYLLLNAPSQVCRLYYLMATSAAGEPAEGDGGGGVVVVMVDGEPARAETQQQVEPPSREGRVSAEEGLVQLVLMFGSYGYHAAKFLLFVAFSSNFRRALKRACCPQTAIAGRAGSAVTCRRPSPPTDV